MESRIPAIMANPPIWMIMENTIEAAQLNIISAMRRGEQRTTHFVNYRALLAHFLPSSVNPTTHACADSPSITLGSECEERRHEHQHAYKEERRSNAQPPRPEK